MPYSAKQLAWAHTPSGRAELGSATVKKWDKQVKTSGFEHPRKKIARMKAKSMRRSKRHQASAFHRSVSARASARGGY